MFTNKTLIFGPTVEKPNSTAFITKDLVDTILSGDFSKVPLLASYTTNEGLLFEALDRTLKASGVDIPNGPLKLEQFFPYQIRAKINKNRFNMICQEMENIYSLEDITQRKCLVRTLFSCLYHCFVKLVLYSDFIYLSMIH